jgi:hypothetical protein
VRGSPKSTGGGSEFNDGESGGSATGVMSSWLKGNGVGSRTPTMKKNPRGSTAGETHRLHRRQGEKMAVGVALAGDQKQRKKEGNAFL